MKQNRLNKNWNDVMMGKNRLNKNLNYVFVIVSEISLFTCLLQLVQWFHTSTRSSLYSYPNLIVNI